MTGTPLLSYTHQGTGTIGRILLIACFLSNACCLSVGSDTWYAYDVSEVEPFALLLFGSEPVFNEHT